MKIYCFSDSHGYHNFLTEDIICNKPDIIICAGDESNNFNPAANFHEALSFFDWYSNLPVKHKIYVPGNHSCYHKDTLFLTNRGFLKYDDININDKLATFDENKNITYEFYTNRFKGYAEYIYEISGGKTKQLVTNNHNVLVDNDFIKADNMIGKHFSTDQFLVSGFQNNKEYQISDDILRILNFIISDGTLVFKENKNGKYLSRIQFKLSKQRKISLLQNLLKRENIKFTYRLCKRSNLNILQPYYIRIYGKFARKLYNLLNNSKDIPDYFRELSIRQKRIFLDFYTNTDGCYNEGYIQVSTINYNNALKILELSTLCGYNSYIYKNKKLHGFNNAKIIYKIYIDKRIKCKKNKINISKKIYQDDVVCFSIPSKKLITCYKGKIAYSGNTAIFHKLITPDQYPNITFLVDQFVEIDGIRIYGSPWTPNYGNWVYMKPRHKMSEVWKNIPECDILIVHGMPKGCLDLTRDLNGELIQVGCANLLKKVLQIKPSIGFFGGHIHSERGINNNGVVIKNGIKFYNCSCLNHHSGEINYGHLIEI